MKRMIGIVLLGIGIVISASFGSLNGERHVEYRVANGKVSMFESADQVVKAGEKLNTRLKKKGIDYGKMTTKEYIDFVEESDELKKQIKATDAAFARMKAWGEGQDLPLGMAHAKAEADAIGLPEPKQRFMQWFEAGGIGWLIGLVFIVVGAVLARMQDAEEAKGTSATAAARVDFGATMAEVQRRLKTIGEQIADLPMDADASGPREAIDAIDDELLTPLVEGRAQLVAKHGLAGFSEYFGPFSAGERNLNRVWSALTDGHAVVARDALVSSVAGFTAAQESFERVERRG